MGGRTPLKTGSQGVWWLGEAVTLGAVPPSTQILMGCGTVVAVDQSLPI
jgi:hypothetical protein